MTLKDKLTIVIPSYNEVGYIRNTLISIIKQCGVTGIKIIVADNNSEDGTVDVVNEFIKEFEGVIDISLIKGGPVAKARNNGSVMVTTDYILFLDADSVLLDEHNIIDNMNTMLNLDLDLLTCEIKSVGSDIRTKIGFFIFNFINKILSKMYPFAIGGYFLTRTDKFFEYGMFDETLNNSEDFWLSKKYNPKKFKISTHKYGQDDRRFKKMGYLGMVNILFKNYINRNNIEYFRKDVGYWD